MHALGLSRAHVQVNQIKCEQRLGQGSLRGFLDEGCKWLGLELFWLFKHGLDILVSRWAGQINE